MAVITFFTRKEKSKNGGCHWLALGRTTKSRNKYQCGNNAGWCTVLIKVDIIIIQRCSMEIVFNRWKEGEHGIKGGGGNNFLFFFNNFDWSTNICPRVNPNNMASFSKTYCDRIRFADPSSNEWIPGKHYLFSILLLGSTATCNVFGVFQFFVLFFL